LRDDELFRMQLNTMNDMEHPLVKLAGKCHIKRAGLVADEWPVSGIQFLPVNFRLGE
jgi:hypothetical protein